LKVTGRKCLSHISWEVKDADIEDGDEDARQDEVHSVEQSFSPKLD